VLSRRKTLDSWSRYHKTGIGLERLYCRDLFATVQVDHAFVAIVGELSEAFARRTVCLSVTLSHATSSKTVRFTAIVTMGH